MADFTISVDDDVLEVLKTIATYRKMTVEEVLRGMVLDDIEGIKRRMNDPIIGLLEKYGDIDPAVSSQADDIIKRDWQPD